MKELNDVEKLRKAKSDLGLSYDKLGKIMGVHYRTVYLWLSGQTKPSPMGQKCIKEFLKNYYKGG